MINAVQIIGEAALVTDSGRAKVPRLPYGKIVASRNILVHVYWGRRPRPVVEDGNYRYAGLARNP